MNHHESLPLRTGVPFWAWLMQAHVDQPGGGFGWTLSTCVRKTSVLNLSKGWNELVTRSYYTLLALLYTRSEDDTRGSWHRY